MRFVIGRFAPLWCRTAKTFGDPTAVIDIGTREVVDHLDLDDLRAFAQRTDNPPNDARQRVVQRR